MSPVAEYRKGRLCKRPRGSKVKSDLIILCYRSVGSLGLLAHTFLGINLFCLSLDCA